MKALQWFTKALIRLMMSILGITIVAGGLFVAFAFLLGDYRAPEALAHEIHGRITERVDPQLKMEKTLRIAPASYRSADRTHIVERGEWLSKIAADHETTIEALVKANRKVHPSLTKNPGLIHPGWKLSIPHRSANAVTKSSPEKSVTKQSVHPETIAKAVTRDKHIALSNVGTQKRITKKEHRGTSRHPEQALRLRLERNLHLVDRIVNEYSDDVATAREIHGIRIPTDLVLGMIWVESQGNPKAVSPVGARGVMQLMPGTHAELGLSKKDAFIPEKNILGGMKYLRDLYDRLGNNESAAIAAYERGETGLKTYMARGGDPSQTEYVTRVKIAQRFFAEYRKNKKISM